MRKVFNSGFNSGHGLAKCLATTTLFLLCGCTEEVQFEQIFSTEHFNYYVAEDVKHEPCDGAKVWLEHSYEGMSQLLGVTLPPGQKIEYHYDGGHDMPQCINGFPCAIGTTIYSSQYIGQRDIALALANFVGDPPLIFQEGLTEVLGCVRSSDSQGPLERSEPVLDWNIESKDFEWWAEHNGIPMTSTAGTFVRQLIDTHGLEKFLSFYAKAPRNGTRSEIDAVFEQEFGVTLKEEIIAWRWRPMPLPGDICIRATECEANVPLLPNGQIDLECGPEGYGNQGVFRFQIGENQAAQIVTAPHVSDPQVLPSVTLHRCSGGNAMVSAMTTSGFKAGPNKTLIIDPEYPNHQFLLDAPAGDYVAWFWAMDPVSIDIQSTGLPSPMRDGCTPAAEPVLLEKGRALSLSSRWTERACQGFWCPGRSWDVKIGPTGGSLRAGPFTFDGRPLYSPNNIYVCSNPCPTTLDQCEQLVFNQNGEISAKSQQVFAPGTVVHVGAPLSPYPEHFQLLMRLETE